MTMIEATQSSRPKLPVLMTAFRSLTFMSTQWRLLTSPFVALLLVDLLIEHFIIRSFQQTKAASLIFPADLLLLLVEASFVVGIHRTILLGEAHTGITFFRLDANWVRYVMTWLITTIGFTVIFGIYAVAIWIGRMMLLNGHAITAQRIFIGVAILTGVVLGIFLIIKLALAFPAAALGERGCFRLSWRKTKGNVWRLFWLGMLISLPLFLLALPVELYSLHAVTEAMRLHQPRPVIHWTPGIEIWNSLIKSYGLVVYAVALSLSYNVLTRNGRTNLPD
jgi:hypothetical protein